MIKLNGVEIKPTMFPDKTSQVWKLDKEELDPNHRGHAEIEWDFEHEGEFMHLAQLKMLLMSVDCPAYLKLSYLPYGRQDKPIDNTRTFALYTFCKLLASLNFIRITCLDPHSGVANQLLENFYAEYPIHEICESYFQTHSRAVVFPDEGARQKYRKVLKDFKFPEIVGSKQREESTGYILRYEIEENLISVPTNLLIVDDICDGGMTFILLAKALKEKGATDINLFVTHGIFSKGLQVLRDAGIKRIFTAKGEQ